MNELEIAKQDGLLALGIEKGLDTETLSKLIALRNAEIERVAKTEFGVAFAKMQADLVPISRSKVVPDQNGRKLYAFCPLEDVLAVVAPILAAHALSYRWSEESLPSGEKRVWCHISGCGYTESSYVDIPIGSPASRSTNPIQQRGVATTYGKRYSFLSATGAVVGGEDDDGGANVRNPLPKAQDGAYSESEGDATPYDPSEDIRVRIKAAIAELVKVLEDGCFTDDDRVKAKAKLAVVNGRVTGDSLTFVETVLREYKTKAHEWYAEKGGEAARPGELI